MRNLRIIVLIGVLAVLLGQGARSTTAQQLPDLVNVKVVDYKGLCDLVESHKGKVVLLDFWATNCMPCRKSFFQNAEWYKAYGDKGLVIISVSTFEYPKIKKDAIQDGMKIEDEKVKAALVAKEKSVLSYLQSQNATFTNVILDEPDKLVEDKLRIVGIPCIYVFNPEGKWTQFAGDKLVHDDATNRYPEVAGYIKHLIDDLAKKK